VNKVGFRRAAEFESTATGERYNACRKAADDAIEAESPLGRLSDKGCNGQKGTKDERRSDHT